MDPELLLWQEAPLSVFYAPFDWVNTAARVMLIGITPGYFQASEALRETQRCLRAGFTNEETLRRQRSGLILRAPARQSCHHARRHRAS